VNDKGVSIKQPFGYQLIFSIVLQVKNIFNRYNYRLVFIVMDMEIHES